MSVSRLKVVIINFIGEFGGNQKCLEFVGDTALNFL